MNKAVLMSIQPYYVFLIIARAMSWNIPQHKTVEVRKNFPQDSAWNKVVHIYCSQNRKSFNRIPKEYQPLMEKFLGKVIGEFVCDRIEDFSEWQYDYPSLLRHIDLYAGTNGDYPFLDRYLKGKKQGYGWHISNLKIYDKPKELSEFNGLKKCNSCKVSGYDSGACIYDEDCMIPVPLERPPQSWQYIWE